MSPQDSRIGIKKNQDKTETADDAPKTAKEETASIAGMSEEGPYRKEKKWEK